MPKLTGLTIALVLFAGTTGFASAQEYNSLDCSIPEVAAMNPELCSAASLSTQNSYSVSQLTATSGQNGDELGSKPISQSAAQDFESAKAYHCRGKSQRVKLTKKTDPLF